jgi:membrane-associated phospholipid phosphatase
MTHATRTAAAATLTALWLTATPADLDAQTISQQALEAGTAAGESAAGSASFGNLFVDTIEDFRRIASWQNVAILTVGGIGATFTHAMDRDVTTAMSQSSGLDGLLHSGEMIGGARTQLAAALATYAVGRISGHGKVSEIGSDLIRAQIVTQAMTAAIKLSVGRTRPDGTQYSFPSGHSSVTFATATVLQRNLGWKVGVPAYGLATFVAASRVQDKRHFLSDVTFGAALGIVGGRTVTIGRGDARFAVSPAPAPGGAAVSFTWLGAN